MGKLRIDLLGSHFTIQANEDDEYLNKLLGYYKRITDDVHEKNGINDNLQIAVLSGIMLCDELYKEKQNKIQHQYNNGVSAPTNFEVSEKSEEISRKAQEMIEKINKVL